MTYTLAIISSKNQNVSTLLDPYVDFVHEDKEFFKGTVAEEQAFVEKYYGEYADIDEEKIKNDILFQYQNARIDNGGNIYIHSNPICKPVSQLQRVKLHWRNEELYSIRISDVDDWELFSFYNPCFPTYAVIDPAGSWFEMCPIDRLLTSQVFDDEVEDWVKNYYDRFVNSSLSDNYLQVFFHYDISDEHYNTNLVRGKMRFADDTMYHHHYLDNTITPREYKKL